MWFVFHSYLVEGPTVVAWGINFLALCYVPVVVVLPAWILFTVRCKAERGIAMASSLSVCPFICLMFRNCDDMGWNSWKIISRLTSLLSTDPYITDPLQRITPNFSRNSSGVCEKIGFGRTKPVISPKRLKIKRKLLFPSYIKSYTGFPLPPKCITLNDL